MSLSEWFENTFYNDIGQIPLYLITFALALAVLAAAIFFHELGHWFFFKVVKKKNIKIQFIVENWHSFHWEAGKIEDYDCLTEEQYKNMLLTGIMSGFIPIILSSFLWFPFLMMVIPYAAGIWKDAKEIMDRTKIED